MKRSGEIIEALKTFFEKYECEMDADTKLIYVGAFAAGVEWADRHPNLKSIWHDASEEPQGDEWHIAYIDVFGLIHSLKCPSVAFDTFPSLAEFAAGVGMQCWAYISDLLPKRR